MWTMRKCRVASCLLSLVLIIMAFLLAFVPLVLTFLEVESLKTMELQAPYKIQSVATTKFLTTEEQGILGLRTGSVRTMKDGGKLAPDQQWTLTWDPTIDDLHNGYRIESSHEYLNEVTTFYPDGRTRAIPNIWEIIELDGGRRILRNKRSQRCLTALKIVGKKEDGDVAERTCSFKSRWQQWRLLKLDLDKRIRADLLGQDVDQDDYY